MTETGNPWVDPIDEWIENKKTNLEREMNDGQYSDQLALLLHLQKFMKTLPKVKFVEGTVYEAGRVVCEGLPFADVPGGTRAQVGIEVKDD
jgi:hypothetical protein